MGILELINALLPLFSNLEPLLVAVIAELKAQSGLTSEQILDKASATLDETGKALLAEQLRLQDEIKAGGFARVSLMLACALLCGLLLVAGCKTSKVNTDPYAGASKAADDIALTIKLATETERNLETQKLITPQEGLVVIDGLLAIHAADVGFVSDVRAAKPLDPQSAATLLVPALQRIKQAVSDLNAAGVLGIKNPQARATFQTALNTINVAIATIQAILEAKAAAAKTAAVRPERRITQWSTCMISRLTMGRESERTAAAMKGESSRQLESCYLAHGSNSRRVALRRTRPVLAAATAVMC